MTPIKPLLPPTDPISKHHHLGVVVRTSAYEFYGDTSIQFTTASHKGSMSVKVAQSWSDSLRPHGLSSPWNSPGQNTGVGSLSLLQGIFPTQRSNPGLPHCRWILSQLIHKGIQGKCNVVLWTWIFLCVTWISLRPPEPHICPDLSYCSSRLCGKIKNTYPSRD